MLVYVPQGYVALVYERGELRSLLESGVGVVSNAGMAEVKYVYLQPYVEPSDEAEAAMTLQ